MSAHDVLGVPKNTFPQGQTLKLVNQVLVGGTGFGTPLSYSCAGYRNGDRLIGKGYIQTGTIAAALAWIQIPRGLTINLAPFAERSSSSIAFGHYTAETNSGTAQSVYSNAGYAGVLFYDGVSPDRLYFAYRGSSSNWTQDTANAFVVTNFVIEFDFDIPIAQWSN